MRISGLNLIAWGLTFCPSLFAQAGHDHRAHSRVHEMEGMGPGSGSSGWYSSGTSQIPLASPMYGLHRRLGSWTVMLQANAFAVYSNQTGARGRDKIFGPHWLMPMATRRVGPGSLTFRSMFTLEPATITRKRYPLIFQTGELANDIPIINGQHPHEFFMELGASYQLRIGDRTALNFFAGPRGEPTLGPPAFPHRITASENPMAVLSHHYQDSTHISSSVFTAGLTHGRFTLEASGFHGREPDERRWGMETGAIDSFATRLTVNPSSRWTAQFSIGRINNREATHPLRDSLRTSASVFYVRPLATGHWASCVIWGRNHDLEFTQLPQLPLAEPAMGNLKEIPQRRYHVVYVPTRIPGQIYNSYLAESTLFFHKKHWIWGRVENTDRDTLLLFEEAPFVRLVEEQRYTRVQAYTGGYERELPSPAGWLSVGLGGQLTIFVSPDNLKPIYGSKPLGLQVFLRMRLRDAER